jgi:Phosphotransferase enzyme family
MAEAPSIIAATVCPDAKVERSIFGTDDPDSIWEQVLDVCPDARACFAFRVSIGAMFGLELRDGSRVALKLHTAAYPSDYLAAAQAVQEHLWRRGFPCPRPLGIRGRATIEEWNDGGTYRDGHEPEVRRALAATLARLIELTGELRPVPPLRRGFSFPDGGAPLWPAPHNVLFDFEATAAGAEWIDAIAAAARRIRDEPVGRTVVGHGDWVANHVRFEGAQPSVAYDWDSLDTDREPNFVGCSAATFTYMEHLPVEVQPTVEETLAFIADYEAACGSALTLEERRATLAAAVYVRAYATRCGHALGGEIDRAAVETYAEALL